MEYLEVILETGNDQACTQTNIQDSQIGLRDRGVTAQVYTHGDHDQYQRITSPFLEGKQADPVLGNVDNTLNVFGSKF